MFNPASKLFLFLLCIALIGGCSPVEEQHLEGYWKKVPDIEICYDFPRKKSEVIDMLEWWHDISPAYQYGRVYGGSCFEEVEEGVIRFAIAGKGLGYAGLTEVHYKSRLGGENVTEVMKSATIFVKKDGRDRVLKHEIGHAYGWDHFLVPGHIMETGGEYGEDTDGLEVYPWPEK